jgi:pimeloyl-ACP methyl ester carboxylesterase
VQAHLPDAVAIDLPSNHVPGGDFADDVAAVRAALDGMEGPVVLCGHSYGGAVISEAGTHPKVGHLVYLASMALDAGETMMSNAASDDPEASSAPPAALGAAMRVEGDALVLDPAGAAAAFYGDCDEKPVDRLVPHPLAAFGTPVTSPAWADRPSTFVLCTRDEAIRPEVQRFFARRCTTTVELEASHSPMLSMPDRVAEILRAASV